MPGSIPDAHHIGGAPGTPAEADEGIPEYEPLTPELVEEEAIRGDFVLKWAVVLLAFMLGSSRIAETATLVHVKTGQFLAANGILPPANDVFSYTASDRPWTNLSWGFDLLAAGIHSLGDWAGLSLFKAFVAALAFLLVVRITRPGLPTWWGAVCAAIALLACHVRLSMQPALVTLVGTSVTLWLVHNWQQQTSPCNRIWLLVPLFLVWSNVDPRMFIGLGLLALYGVGDGLGAALGWGASLRPDSRRKFWLVFAGCVVAAMIHPFGWKTLAAPAMIYGGEYAAFRSSVRDASAVADLQYFPLTFGPVWAASNLDISFLAGLLLVAVAAVSFVLNGRRLELSHVVLYVGCVVFAVLALHELPMTGLVCCVLAVLNGQGWYAGRFRQTYSVDTREVLFSRGGRALTVLAFFAIAFLGGTGRLRGVQAPRTGYGIDHNLASAIESFQDLLKDSFDDRPFNFVPGQGDLLIWLGQRVFVDNRRALYYAHGDADLLKLHSDVRNALRNKRSEGIGGSGDKALWKKVFDQFQVTHVLPRLTGASPDYITLIDLLGSPDDWQLTRLGAASAVLYRIDKRNPELARYVDKQRLNLSDEAFKKPASLPTSRVEWVHAPTFYETYVWARKREIPNSIQEAMHLVHLAARSPAPAPLAILGIRKAQAGLTTAPDCAEGYLALGRAYWLLARWESFAIGNPNPPREGLRYYQAVASFNQALVADPKLHAAHVDAYNLYEAAGKADLALRELELLNDAMESAPEGSEEEQAERDQMFRREDYFHKMMEALDAELANLTQQGAGPAQLALFAFQQRGCVLKALEQLDRNPEVLENMDVKRLRVLLLMESGRAEEAYIETGMLEEIARQGGNAQGWTELTALASLANADYLRAVQLWTDSADQIDRMSLQRLLAGIAPTPGNPQSPQPPWPIPLTEAAAMYFAQRPQLVSSLRRQVALVELEAGGLEKAQRNFRALLKANPESPARPLAAVYLYQLTGEEIDPLPPSERIPILFEDEPGAKKQDAKEPENKEPASKEQLQPLQK